MSKASFEKVQGSNFSKAFKNDRKLELRMSESGSTSVTAPEHIYIVFSEEISIEDGIRTIESEVLSGDALRVTRFDVTGHAAVAIVTPSQRKHIEDLPIINRIKVMEIHHPNSGKFASDQDAFL